MNPPFTKSSLNSRPLSLEELGSMVFSSDQKLAALLPSSQTFQSSGSSQTLTSSHIDPQNILMVILIMWWFHVTVQTGIQQGTNNLFLQSLLLYLCCECSKRNHPPLVTCLHKLSFHQDTNSLSFNWEILTCVQPLSPAGGGSKMSSVHGDQFQRILSTSGSQQRRWVAMSEPCKVHLLTRFPNR